MHRDLSIAFLLLLIGTGAFAQSTSRTAFGAADRYLWKRQHRGKIDTTYIGVPEEKWTFKLYSDQSITQFHVIERSGGDYSSETFETVPRILAGVSVSYRGLTLSMSHDWTKKLSEASAISLNSYGNRFVIESNLTLNNHFRGYDNSSHSALDVDVFYFGNGKHFSPPAVFNQSKIQRKNSGSWIIAASLNSRATSIPTHEDVSSMDITGHTMGLGGGYAYNWVEDKWLLHISLIPTIVINDHSYIKTDTGRRSLNGYILNTLSTGHFSAIYNYKNIFTGITINVHSCFSGNPDDVGMNYLRMQGFVVLGLRL